MGVIVEAVREMLKNHPAIDQRQTLLVYFNQFADSSLNIMVYCFTKTRYGLSGLPHSKTFI